MPAMVAAPAEMAAYEGQLSCRSKVASKETAPSPARSHHLSDCFTCCTQEQGNHSEYDNAVFNASHLILWTLRTGLHDKSYTELVRRMEDALHTFRYTELVLHGTDVNCQDTCNPNQIMIPRELDQVT